MASIKRPSDRRRAVRGPSRKKAPSRRERQMREILDLAEQIEREGVSESEGPRRLSKWGLPANETLSFNNYSKATARLIEKHNALIDLKQDALDAYEQGIIDRGTYDNELRRLRPLLDAARAASHEAMREEGERRASRRGAIPTARRKVPHKRR